MFGERWISAAARSAFIVAVALCPRAHAQAPRNDLCINATPIFECVDFTGTTINAGSEGQAPCRPSSRDVFYRFTPSETRSYRIYLCGSSQNWDTVLSVHTGCPATQANAIACNDDSCGAKSEIESVLLESQVTYLIRVAGGGTAGLNANRFIIQICSAASSTSGACCCTQACTCTFLASASACTCDGCETGVWIPGGVCTPVDYCQIKGACCGANQTCLLTFEQDCPGSFLGVGAPCGPVNPCAQTSLLGACCKGSTCQPSSVSECLGANTRFAGVGTVCNIPGNFLTPCCLADFNQSGSLTVQDLFDFMAAYFTADPFADINASGAVTPQDLFDFMTAYFEGCG
ncbi:MAG: GC-type dockerin domain-anchored protein [Phycisphaerales bacterium]